MAFITHPLPSPKSAPFQSSVRTIPTSALSPGVISVSRRRRVYEFLRESTTSIQSTEKTSTPSSSSSSSSSTTFVLPSYPSSTTSSPDVDAIRAALLERAKQHEQAVHNDAITKAQQWYHEMSALREISPTSSSIPAQIIDRQSALATTTVLSPQISSPVHEEKNSQVNPVVQSSSKTEEKTIKESQQVSSQSQASAVETVKEEKIESSQKSQPNTVKTTPIFELYSPPPSKNEDRSSKNSGKSIVETAVKTVKEVVDKVTSSVESVTEKEDSVTASGSEQVLADSALSAMKNIKSTTKKVSSTVEKVVKPKSEKQDDSPPKSIGEAILDAIVDGVPSPQTEEVPQVDKSDLIELVDTGKIKNLTVTKLRRLLSANNLKTSGRKSELIARLTSFAKAK